MRRTHGADVLRNLYVILHRGGVLRQSQKDHHQAWLLASYLAAIVHDYEHRGVNNDFLIKTGDQLAVSRKVPHAPIYCCRVNAASGAS